MMAAHYPLQALLYAVAVHRMLRWRQPDYVPIVSWAGCCTSSFAAWPARTPPGSTGVPCGVFSWRPAAGAGGRVSDLLERGPQ